MRPAILLALGIFLIGSAAALTPRPAEAAPTIGDGSCMVAGACDSLHDNVVIGDNSCNAPDACDQASGVIGDNSCNQGQSCLKSGYFGSANIGDGSCNGLRACQSNGSFGNGSVADAACNGQDACLWNGFLGNGSIGTGSCIGLQACFHNGLRGTGIIGIYSCNGDAVCTSNGSFGVAVIGDCQNNTVPVAACGTPLDALIAEIEAIDGLGGVADSLLAQAESIAEAPNPKAKAGKLKAFGNHVDALRGKKLSDAEADYLIALVESI